MATKQEELSNPFSKWNTLKPDTPILILDASDPIAPFLARQWARHVLMLNGEAENVGSEMKPDIRLRHSEEVRRIHDEAMQTAARMEAWHGPKRIPGAQH